MVRLNHGGGVDTCYAHLSHSMVQTGQAVRRGQIVGEVGATGRATAPHLHYEVRRNGVSQNPVDYFFDDIDAARYRAQMQEYRAAMQSVYAGKRVHCALLFAGGTMSEIE